MKFKLGDYVCAGTDGAPDFDVGEIISVRNDGVVYVKWYGARETYAENPCDLRPSAKTPIQWLAEVKS